MSQNNNNLGIAPLPAELHDAWNIPRSAIELYNVTHCYGDDGFTLDAVFVTAEHYWMVHLRTDKMRVSAWPNWYEWTHQWTRRDELKLDSSSTELYYTVRDAIRTAQRELARAATRETLSSSTPPLHTWKSIILASASGLVFGIGLSVILVVIINAILTLIQP